MAQNGDPGGNTFDGLARQLQAWAHELGFSQIGVADVDLSSAEAGLLAWLDAGFHGGMGYMARHGVARARPAHLVPATVRIISVRMDYLPRHAPVNWCEAAWRQLAPPSSAYISLYARGRDYHKVLRQRLKTLAGRLAEAIGPFGFRVCTDSAPLLEAELAVRAGIGWRGKHTLVLNRSGGSMAFLGEILIDAPLPLTAAATATTALHCGTCRRCIDICPTQAIVAPGQLDARRCISYLTIEHDGPIPAPLRPPIGNRLYGCDDCQLICPWNKFARRSPLADFDERAVWRAAPLLTLWQWDETAFLRHTEGSAMRRIGWVRWRRNLAVVTGNALRQAAPTQAAALRAALAQAREAADALVREHIDWALAGSK